MLCMECTLGHMSYNVNVNILTKIVHTKLKKNLIAGSKWLYTKNLARKYVHPKMYGFISFYRYV